MLIGRKSFMKSHINQVLISGTIISPPQFHPEAQRLVFMIYNEAGRFYIQATGVDMPDLARGMSVLIRGRLFSVPVSGKDMGRVSADEILRLTD
jgi:hypothetical protein